MKIKHVQNKFRVLKGWKIRHRKPDEGLQGCVSIHPKKKCAVIYGYKNGKPEKDFVLHELLHCAVRSVVRMDKRQPKEQRQAEELLIQDICKIWREK